MGEGKQVGLWLWYVKTSSQDPRERAEWFGLNGQIESEDGDGMNGR